MPSDWQDEEGLPEKRPGRPARRRGPTRAQVIRRRAVAIGSLIVVVIAVIIVLTSSGGDEDEAATGKLASGTGAAPHKKAAKTAASATHSALVTNATPQADWKPHKGPVPILEYHVLGAPPEGAPYPELYVGRTDFEKQMDWLDEHGYQAVTLEQVQEAWYHGGTLPPKPVVISFDDGYRPQFTFALPTLRKHGWAGLLNLKAEGSELYESNVKAMIAAGWEVAAHTIHHLDLTELGPEELEEEVAGSRKILQRDYKIPVNNFCYPAGQFDETVIEAVEKAGYTGATTEISGFAASDKPYELARLEILRESHVAGLAEDLRNGEGETAEGGG
ncbi:MAG TPA: polysaccharide deacetylase family protein [Solirubrobacterales bacterium]|jgi:peptidoglycan/xylan/chitin deacetylase (PgdA/CDA1 family)|nr:polysaccharide deacetylase family protein [Solirubrobacterales bacterium]